jgi:hypothetical protein
MLTFVQFCSGIKKDLSQYGEGESICTGRSVD